MDFTIKIQAKQAIMWSWIKTYAICGGACTSLDPSYGVRTPCQQPGHVGVPCPG